MRTHITGKQPHRVGTETFEHGLLVTRVLRKPPTWTVEKVRSDGDIDVYQLRKMGRSNPVWHLVGPYTDTLHGNRAGALRFCADILEPLGGKGDKKEAGLPPL